MFAFFWLLLAIMAGWRWSGLIFVQPRRFLLRASPGILQIEPNPVLSSIFQAAAALWLGIMPLTWLNYILAYIFHLLLPATVHPLSAANTLLMAVLVIYLAIPYVRAGLLRIKDRAGPDLSYESGHSARWPAFVRSLQKKEGRFYVISLFCFLLFAVWLMTLTFNRAGTLLRAGYSVFSDFAPHTALVSSFARGANWPTQYPHFAGDGISYHFMFYFLCGNLDFLGMTTDWAINLPSILGLLTFCALLGTLAVILTGRRLTFFLAPALLFLRSSFAFFTYLADLLRLYGTNRQSWPWILRQMAAQSSFIGHTPRDEWGLWGINVYANQRHLLPGFSLTLLVLIIFLPDLAQGWQPGKTGFGQSLRLQGWLPHRADDLRRMTAAICICFLMPYWHGSALVGLLLILSVIAIFSRNRLAIALSAAAAVAGALIQTSFFAGSAAGVIRPQILTGFIAENKSLAGILMYLLEMSGLAIPMLLLSLLIARTLLKILLAAFIVPLLFALTVSLTPDVTVNHKYIIMTLALGNIFIADLLLRIWKDGIKLKIRGSALLPGRIAACLLAIILMVTGLQEMVIVRNINRNYVTADLAAPLVRWIKDNTAGDAVFITAPHHYHSFFLAGRYAWLGHSYYAWSAGHDTGSRMEEQEWLLRGGSGDPSLVDAYIDENELDYLLIDNQLRQHPQFNLNEEFFLNYYVQETIIMGPENIVVINLQQRKNR